MRLSARLLCGAAAAGLFIAMGAPQALAQTASPQAPESEAGPVVLDEIVVTGSRIRRSGTDTPTPTTIINAETIRQSGVSEIADLVNQVPSLFVTQNNQTSNQQGNAGLNALDLRGLGTERTLVLVNGRRRVPAMPGSSAVDVSAIPAGLVERIDVITGGASALYGADAVAGVANFILKDDFEGLEFSAMYSDSSRNDMPGYNADILWGRNTADGRGNITAFGAYSRSDGVVLGQDRPWTAMGTPLYVRQPDGTYRLTDDNRQIYDLGTTVVQLGGATNFYTFNPDGSPRPVVLGPGGILNPTAGDFAQYRTDGGEFGGRYDDWALVVPSERYTVAASGNYQINDDLRLFGDVTYSHTDSRGIYRAYSSYGYDVLSAGNPFITPEMVALNGAPIGSLAFARRFNELGLQETRYDRGMYQVTVGLEGSFPAWGGRRWDWVAHYSIGETEQDVTIRNATAVDRYFLALDAVSDGAGGAACASTLFVDPSNGCVPLNPFRTLTSDVINYLQYDTSPATHTLEQRVFSAYATGDLFDLPAGAVQGVLGIEYRKESNDIQATPEYDPDHALFDPGIGVTQRGLSGGYSVSEVFSELRVPLLRDLPMAEDLSFEGAIRFSDYSTAGETTAYKAALNWQPVRDLRFRTTYGQAVRAPNISELYSPEQAGGAWLADPCNYWDVVNRISRTEFTQPNCATIAPDNVNTYWQWLDVNSRGNEDLDVETATTFTAGVVIQPRILPGFSLTVDYFEIDLEDAIGAFDAQTIMYKCVDAASLNNQFCDLVNRDPATGNLISVNVQQLNLSRFATRGLDLEVNYRVDLADLGLGDNSGSLSVNAVYTRLYERSFTLDPTDASTHSETSGLFGSPKWKGAVLTSYSNGPWTLNWNLRHVSPMRPGSHVTADLYDVHQTDHVFYSDFYAGYDVNEQVSVFGGLRNAFDEAPPRLPGAEAGGANFEFGYQAGVYDVIGRTFYVGLRWRR